MGRRLSRRRKNRNGKTGEDNKTNILKMQIDNDEQYVELENIQLEEDHIMEGESLEPEPSLHDSPELMVDSPDEEETKDVPERDTKKLKDENNSEEELQPSEENNEPVKSEDEDDIVEEEKGISITLRYSFP